MKTAVFIVMLPMGGLKVTSCERYCGTKNSFWI